MFASSTTYMFIFLGLALSNWGKVFISFMFCVDSTCICEGICAGKISSFYL